MSGFNGMDVVAATAAMDARSKAASAERAARAARDASEERLEGGTRFVVLTNVYQVVKQRDGWFSKKEVLVPGPNVSIKVTDISSMKECDQFPGYTRISMEKRCDDYSFLHVSHSLDYMAKLLNNT